MAFVLRAVVTRFPFAIVIALIFCSFAAAQSDYSKSAPIFPNVTRPYAPRHVAQPSFVNSPRLNNLIKDGKLLLSLNDAVALALENNLDLVIARYNLPIADTDILRTKSGATDRGVNTGLVEGTPGAGVGGIGSSGGGAGGTSTAAGGAGTGTGGLVSSTLGVGPPVDSYDPIISSSLGVQHANTPESNTIFTGVPSLLQNTATANFGYQQGFPTGTLFSVTYDNSRVTSNSTRTFLVPQLNSNYLVQVRQHLLQGFSVVTNKRYMIIAKNNREITDVGFRQQVIFTVSQIEDIYWALVSAHEDFQAKQRALNLAQQLEENNRKQVEAGTLPAIEIVNAEAQVAANQQALIVSQTNLQLQQELMKNALSRNQSDAVLAAASVVPTDRMQLPTVEPVIPTQDLVNEALHNRPELTQSQIDLRNREISQQSARNAMLPAIDLVANYGGTSLAGNLSPYFSATGSSAAPVVSNTGFVDALTGLNGHPTYFVGFNLNIPIKNRSAQADQIRSELEYRQAQVRLQQLQNEIAIDVRNAQYAVQQNRAQVEAALKARDYQSQSLDAERKKLELGTSTTYNVMTMMSNLSTAESNVVAAMTAYEDSKVNLSVTLGRTLDDLGINVADAETGNVNHMPHVPGVVPSDEALQHPIAPASSTEGGRVLTTQPSTTPQPTPGVPNQQQNPATQPQSPQGATPPNGQSQTQQPRR